nr:MAG TPA: hypothetical protein [Caudoviricetes sp.]
MDRFNRQRRKRRNTQNYRRCSSASGINTETSNSYSATPANHWYYVRVI